MAIFLAPREFGMIAMLQVFIGVAQTCADSGMSQALIRRPRRAPEEDATALYINVAAGLVCYLLLWLVAPWVARFYDEPLFVDIIRLLSLAVPVNSLCVVQTARLSIAMDFRQLFRVSGIAVVCSGILGITLACCGMGVWALVWQQLSMWTLRALLLWCLSPRFPSWHFNKKVARSLYGFSWKVMASGILNTVWENIYSVIIGKCFTPRLTGLFWRASTFSTLPASTASSVIGRVAYPLMGRVQSSPLRLKVVFFRMMGMSAWIIFPCMMLMSTLAGPLFATLFNEQWAPAVPMFRVLCLSAMFYPIHSLNLQMLYAVGRSDLFLKLEIIKKILIVGILCIAVPYGVQAICEGILAFSLLSLPINMWYSRRYAHAGIVGQLLSLLPVVVLSILVALAAYAVSTIFSTPVIALSLGLLSGVCLYILASHLLSLPWWHRLRHLKI